MIKRLGNIVNDEWKGGSYAYTVFDCNGSCPSLNTCSGGGRQPMIVEVRLEADCCDEGKKPRQSEQQKTRNTDRTEA